MREACDADSGQSAHLAPPDQDIKDDSSDWESPDENEKDKAPDKRSVQKGVKNKAKVCHANVLCSQECADITRLVRCTAMASESAL